LIPFQTYYMQSPPGSGNGKQKGNFIHLNQPFDVLFAKFELVSNVSSNSSGYATGFRTFRCDQTQFYLPEKEEITERVMVNAVLKSITGDPCFEFYPGSRFHCIPGKNQSVLIHPWISDLID